MPLTPFPASAIKISIHRRDLQNLYK